MKLNYYIRGFGAGVIVATIVLMVAGKINANNDSLKSKEEPTTKGSVLAYTTEADNRTTTEAGTEATTDAKTESATEAKTETTTTAQVDKPTEPTTAAKVETPTEPTTEAKTEPAKESDNNSDGTVTVYFNNVYTAAQAASILYNAGVIQDEYEFYMFMYTTGYDRRIKDGEYTVTPGDSYDNIARIITRS